MQYEKEPVAKRYTSNLVQYVCQACGGWQTLVGTSDRFLPFIDHLIRDLAMLQHPALRGPRLVGHQIWYQLPDTNEMICGLPPYEPDSNEWKRLLAKGQKILPQAKFFLLDIADWLEKALSSLEGLKSIRKSDLLAAEQVLTLMPTLAEEFQEQREYLLDYREQLEEACMDPKWLGRPGRQAEFIARSMAGARWGLLPSSSREMIRQIARNPRGPSLRQLKIQGERRWWEPVDET